MPAAKCFFLDWNEGNVCHRSEPRDPSNELRVDQLLVLGMGNLQPLMTGILIMGPYKPLRSWVDEFIPYYMEIMGVDRPDRTNDTE